MRSAGERVDGSQMGFAGEVETDACFVYDARGPRTSPAIEVQAWIDPPLVGQPYATEHHVGFQALGFAVRELEATARQLVELGATRLGPDRVLDPTGVRLDLVEDAGVEGSSRFAHVRATCSDLERSRAWYETLSFETLTTEEGAGTSSAHLRLPDEPFELRLVEWHEQRSTGRPYDSGNHAGLYRFAIAVDDTRAAYDALADVWALTSPPRPVALPGTNLPDLWVAFLSDPDGMVVELVERPRDAFR
jgi:catechol 2,3-dioxygenase-like lactoylglutathione lyase family enzyme